MIVRANSRSSEREAHAPEPGSSSDARTAESGRARWGRNRKGWEEVYSAGGSFFVPKGANTTWILYDTVSKFWMITES